MSGIIHFGSGKELKITELEFSRIGPKLNAKGIRTQVTADGHLIPLNSTTMEFIEKVSEPKPEEEGLFHGPGMPKPLPMGEDGEDPAELPPMNKVEDKPKKTNDELLEEMMAKSNCKHEPEKLELYMQHTAKGIRYFPVCSFCGKRERYVSENKIVKGEYAGTVNEKWTAEDVAHAKPWLKD